MPEWIAQNIGTALTVGGSIIVAIIAAVGGWWAKNHAPRQPIPIQDVWTENRALRADLLSTERRYDELEEKYWAVRDALYALRAYVRRVRTAWGVHATIPSMTASEHRKLAAVVDDTETPGAGTPAPTP